MVHQSLSLPLDEEDDEAKFITAGRLRFASFDGTNDAADAEALDREDTRSFFFFMCWGEAVALGAARMPSIASSSSSSSSWRFCCVEGGEVLPRFDWRVGVVRCFDGVSVVCSRDGVGGGGDRRAAGAEEDTEEDDASSSLPLLPLRLLLGGVGTLRGRVSSLR